MLIELQFAFPGEVARKASTSFRTAKSLQYPELGTRATPEVEMALRKMSIFCTNTSIDGACCMPFHFWRLSLQASMNFCKSA